MAEVILCEREGASTRIIINRPEIGGLVSDAMAQQIADMIDAAAVESKFIVLRSAGKDFCLGRDRGGAPFKPSADALEFRGNSEVVFSFYDAFRRCPIPVVGVVQGRALGFGCAMAALCDITIAAETARFALPEMGHNIMPTMAMSALIDRVGLKGLLYLTYSTAEIDAATALAYGLVSRVVPESALDAELDGLVAALDKAKPPAVKAVKEYARAALDMGMASAIGYARNLHATVNTSGAMRG